MLSDADPAAVPARLDLTWTGGGAVLAFLRRLPLVASFVSAPHPIQWNVVAVYRVRLQIEHPCQSACYKVVLLDATP